MTAEPMLPLAYRVVLRRQETRDSVSLRMAPVGHGIAAFLPGQFTMLYARGVGEVAISVSGDPSAPGATITQTIRDVGAVSRALCRSAPDAYIGVRGPFGRGWGLAEATGHDLVIVAGGVGLAPLRPLLLGALARRSAFGRIVLIAGARDPAEFLFHDELETWAGRPDLDVELTVDTPAAGWPGGVGFVTEPLARLTLDPKRTTAFLCGPEPMMRFCAEVLLGLGLAEKSIRVSLERNMQCGVGLCGHCQLGPLLLCRDGPVVDYGQAEPLLATREL